MCLTWFRLGVSHMPANAADPSGLDQSWRMTCNLTADGAVNQVRFENQFHFDGVRKSHWPPEFDGRLNTQHGEH